MIYRHPALALLSALWIASCGEQKQTTPLHVYCAAALTAPLEELAKSYEQKFGVSINLQLGPSQTLLSNAEVTGLGDLYLPADDSYITMAEKKNLISSTIPLATQTAVLVVKKGNPKQIAKLADLREMRLAIASPDATAIGSALKKTLPTDAWAQLFEKATTVSTVNEAANALKSGAVDATFIWDAMLTQYPEFQALEITELAKTTANVSVALLQKSGQPAAAMRFARFIASSDLGLPVMAKHGLKVVQGDPWAEKPVIQVFAGSMLRPAIEQTLVEFEKREGVEINRVYNGCGILVGQMKAGTTPDAYFACDVEFMKQVSEQFEKPDDIAQNQLVILVQKGNPHGIADLKDLAKPNLRVGIGHEKQCAMGWLTQRTFTQGGVTDSVMKNVVAQVPTGDMLVNSMLAGSLDAAVVYLSNSVGAGDKLDALAIQGIQCAIATQPFAVKRGTPYKQVLERLHATLRSTESQERFTEEGFTWNPAGKSE
ncbi:MAG: extracellular solute-binding protein [Verrucomicrobiaceae bacterium]|nr:extracellular solute-binding protein [Verrucomicrobiaceae bacterium]